MNDVFDTYSKSVGTLLQHLPNIHKAAAIKEPLDSMPGWSVFQGRPRAFVESGGRPVLVGTLLGPTGAGKSALFRALTGIEVPSGRTRPTSLNCVVAAPEGVLNEAGLKKLFPQYDTSEMTTVEVLSDHTRGKNELFFAFYKPSQSNGSSVNLVLADIPDFNSVETANWTRAEQMLSRSEVVVFITHPEGYKDDKVVTFLLNACQNAGHLVYIFNKTTDADAKTMWDDLIRYAQSSDRFATSRSSDGLKLHEFLGTAAAYYWPNRGETVPPLDELKPIQRDSPMFSSLLTGLDAARVILLSLMAATPGGIATSKKIIAQATSEKTRLRDMIATTRDQIGNRAEVVAGTQFPAGRWAELVVEVAKQERPAFLKPLSFLSFILSKAIQEFREFFSKQKKDLRPREDIERDRLRDATGNLVTQWRADYRELANGALSAANCMAARDAFAKTALPPVGEEWDNFVRAEAMQWSRAHPVLSAGLASLSDLLAAGSIAVVAIDWAFISHVPGPHHLGLLAAGAAGIGGAAGLLIKLAKTLQLDGVLKAADEEWRKRRKIEIQDHIEAKFADPLFTKSIKARLAELETAPIQKCADACVALEQLEQRFSNESWTTK